MDTSRSLVVSRWPLVNRRHPAATLTLSKEYVKKAGIVPCRASVGFFARAGVGRTSEFFQLPAPVQIFDEFAGLAPARPDFDERLEKDLGSEDSFERQTGLGTDSFEHCPVLAEKNRFLAVPLAVDCRGDPGQLG